MGPILLLAMQTAAAFQPSRVPRIDFDLADAAPFDPAEIRPLRIWAGDCRAADGDEIVVCGRRSEAERLRVGPLLPNAPTAMDEIGDALSTTLGPLELGSLRQPDGSRAFGIRLKF